MNKTLAETSKKTVTMITESRQGLHSDAQKLAMTAMDDSRSASISWPQHTHRSRAGWQTPDRHAAGSSQSEQKSTGLSRVARTIGHGDLG